MECHRIDANRQHDRPPTSLLIVDDERDQLAEVAEYLRAEGLVVATAASGLEAVRSFDDLRPAMVLVDVAMPVCDGITTAQIMHLLDPAAIIILMSGHAGELARAYSQGERSWDIFSKPLDLDRLTKFLKQRLASIPAAGRSRPAAEQTATVSAAGLPHPHRIERN